MTWVEQARGGDERRKQLQIYANHSHTSPAHTLMLVQYSDVAQLIPKQE